MIRLPAVRSIGGQVVYRSGNDAYYMYKYNTVPNSAAVTRIYTPVKRE
jgi:hypothetical protein